LMYEPPTPDDTTLPPEARVELPPSRLPANAHRSRRPPTSRPGRVGRPVRPARSNGSARPVRSSRPVRTPQRAPRRVPVAAAPVAGTPVMAWESPRLLLGVLLTALALPLLLVAQSSSASAVPDSRTVQVRTVAGPSGTSSSVPAAGSAGSAAKLVPAVARHAAGASQQTTTTTPTTTPDTAASTTEPAAVPDSSAQTATSAPPTTAAPVWTPPPTTAAPPTTAPPTTAPPTTHSESGLASYYAHNPGGCASRTVPRGTRVTIYANGHTASCVVDDYGPFGAGRIIDLSEEVFGQLASLGTGVISVTVTW